MRVFPIVTALLVFLYHSPIAAADKPLALGAESCGQSTCHSATNPWPNSSVSQREYVVWKEKDPHSKAYETLGTPRAVQIAQKLGLGSANKAPLCLSCHSYNPPSDQTEPGFDHTVGIGCEGCHGPSSGWIGVHQAGLYFYQRNVDDGMYPTTDPTKRAELCLSCHVGTQNKFVTHRMMSVGHPRLPFELGFYSWFSESTPGKPSNYAHFTVDDDYLQRKPWPFGAKVWAIGQTVQARQLLVLLTDPKVGNKGLFPEFAFFECQSCHGAELNGPGVVGTLGLPRLNDANLYFVQVAAGLVDPTLSAQLKADVARLRAAGGSSWPEILSASQALEGRLTRLLAVLQTHEFTPDDTRRALQAIADGARQGVFKTYAAAEQAVLAAGSLIDELEKLKELSPAAAISAQSAIRKGLAAFTSVESFRSADLNAALTEVARLSTN